MFLATSSIQDDVLIDDVSLLTRVRDGDQHAMSMIYKRYSRLIYSVALRTVREQSSAEDISQEVFLQLWQSPAWSTVLHGRFSGWLAAVSRNRSIDTLRKRRPEEPIEDLMMSSAGDIVDECEHNIMMERATKIIRRLPEKEQRLLNMAYIEGWTHSEIATLTGIPLGTVKTVLRKAIQALKAATLESDMCLHERFHED
jgi:RNA polymerase sigma-70 factor (ECF subfamily)